ncbi:MAG: histone [archaeon]
MKEKLPILAMETSLKKIGDLRISESAKNSLQMLLTKKIEETTKKASILAAHAGRKTLKKQDIELCLRS